MRLGLMFAVVFLSWLLVTGGPALAGKRGGDAKPKSCQTLLGKWHQAGDSHHMRKVLNKRDKIERKMAKHGCPAPTD